MDKSNKLFLRIPDAFIRNEDGIALNSTDFALLCIFKHLSFQANIPSFSVDATMLKQVLNISETRTLKKSLTNLCVAGVICGNIDKLPKRGPLTITLSDNVINGKPFTRLPIGILDRVGVIGHTGLRLLFFYESHINRTTLRKQFCYSSYKVISNKLSIGEPTIWKYNEILEKENLLTIVRSTLSTDYSYKEMDITTDKIIFTKYNNHYTPNVERM
jgi:hypothetical protein